MEFIMSYLLRSILLLLVIIAKPAFAQAPTIPDVASFQSTHTLKTKDALDTKVPQIEMKTSMGTLTITLYPEKAPISVANFLAYVDDGFYDNSIFHRVIPGFVIQGGGFEDGMLQKKVKAPITNESNNGLTNRRGTLSMARTPNPDSATSQFFINLENNTSLNSTTNKPGYAVFAEVTEGLPIIDMISRVKTGNVKQFRDVPEEPILIFSAKRKEK
jgi:peptidyl-prolyl cis-trans isomerase A (cyclophilin A)